MSVITGQELATYMGLTYATYQSQFDRAIESAELAVAAELGALTFGAGSSEDTLEIKTSRNVVEIKNGILTTVTALTIDGIEVDLDKVQTSYWLVAYEEGFTRGGVVVISYNHGYANKAAMPAMLAEAILQTGSWMFTKTGIGPHIGDRKTSEKLGDWAATYSLEKGFEGSIPSIARKLVQEFKKAPV